MFLSFSFLFFNEVSNFHNNINQSEIRIDDKKLSVELYVFLNVLQAFLFSCFHDQHSHFYSIYVIMSPESQN